MKKLKYSSLLLTGLFLILSAFNTYAAKEEYSKKLNKEWDTDQNITLEVKNKYGNLTIENWAENKIAIEVTITIEAKDQEKADKLLSLIDVKFSEDGDIRKAVTEIEEHNWNGKLEINYMIKLPVYQKNDLKNKYGNIYIDEIHGKTNIDLKYGKLSAEKLLFDDSKPLSKISVGYGKAFINKTTRAKIALSYSECSIEQALALILSSRYSELEVTETKALVADSKYDEYKIHTVNSMVVIGKYSGYGIGKLNKKLDLDIKYTNCEVGEVAPDFKEIKVVTGYGGVKLGIPDGVSYQLDATGKYCNIEHPEGNLNVNQEDSEIKITGTAGTDNTAEAVVTIESKYGNIELGK